MTQPRNTPPRDLTDMILIGAGILSACAGVLYLAGGVTSLLTRRRWVTSAWIDALRVPLHPGNPAAAFGLHSAQLNPATYWIVLTLLICVPLAVASLAARWWHARRATAVHRARALAGRPGLATQADVEAAVGRRQIVRRGRSA